MDTLTRAEAQPLGLWQRYQIRQLTDPACTPTGASIWLLSFAMLIRPKADRRRLGRAFQKLVRRHDGLRLRFEQDDSGWHGVMNPVSAYGLTEVELGEVDDETFRGKLNEVARKPMDIRSEKLVELVLLNCGSRGDAVVWRIHHALTDGFGMIVLAEDLFKYMLGLPILSSALSHRDYIRQWQSPKGARAAEVEAYWARVAADAPPAPDVGRRARGLEPLHLSNAVRESRGLNVRISAQSAEALRARSAETGLSLQHLFFGGFLEAVCRIHGLDRMIFDFSAMRTEPALSNYCGDHTLDPFIIYRPDHGSDPWDRAARLQRQYLEAMAHLPADAARRGSRLEQKMIEAGVYPRQFATYVPRATRREEGSTFRNAFAARAGETVSFGAHSFTPLELDQNVHSLNELQVIAMDDVGTAAFGLGWDADAYDTEDIETLAARICQILDIDLIELVPR
ncbi:Condensation domain-containing protein [Pseudooceanicola antarcticus]|uniref:Condensation domain-containing protein n=1 Tax=Pseudooceanicola antarcticus TaxID=1247613 RepID=A0A285IT92_9RHOB|nr:condensation domain-containing protein [Pseudooceanicola antarcticus]PJE32006.1 hypothetical protein CVM39_02610 [Pseudooceanicola antarcticus]SNY51208.1 Condensation domain-containing protein [Pseudooceanicola antarcticus]